MGLTQNLIIAGRAHIRSIEHLLAERRTLRAVENLPSHIKADIGWPSAADHCDRVCRNL